MSCITHLFFLISCLLLCFGFSPLSSIDNRRLRHEHRRSIALLHSTSSSWSSHLSRNLDAHAAVVELVEPLLLQENPPPDIAFLFVGQFHEINFPQIVKDAKCMLQDSTRLISLVGGGVVGADVEVDEPSVPAMSLLSGRLPVDGAEMDLFYFNELQKPPYPSTSEEWQALRQGSCLLFCDPWSPIEWTLSALHQVVVAGGISTPTTTGPTIALDDQALPQGSLVGICFRGLALQVVVSQGCRPVGPIFTITSSETSGARSIIETLDFKPALEVLEQVAEAEVSQRDRMLMSNGPGNWGVLCGISASLTGRDPEDFLVRQLIGFQPQTKSLVVPGDIRGDQFQFHVRDREAALEDLRLMVKRAKTERMFAEGSQSHRSLPVAAIQISCVARGHSLFGDSGVDLSNIKELLESDSPAIGGFFANGEIGPVGLAGIADASVGETYMHGFTVVAAVLCETVPSTTTEGVLAQEDEAWG